MKLKATLLSAGKNATGFEIPEKFVTQLGSSKRLTVVVTVNGYSYRTSIASMSGTFMLPVSAEVRQNAGIQAGDELELDIVLDTAPREVELPEDFSAALAKDTEAKKFFEGLSYSNKRRIVIPINDAKTPETRQRRIEKSVAALHDGKT